MKTTQTSPEVVIPVGVTTPVRGALPVRAHYPGCLSRALGVFQLVMGVFCLVFGAVWSHSHTQSVYGVFFCIPIVLAGIMGYIAGKKKTNILINGYLATCIISLCALGILVLIIILALTTDKLIEFMADQNDSRKHKSTKGIVVVCGALLTGASLVWSVIITTDYCNTRSGALNTNRQSNDNSSRKSKNTSSTWTIYDTYRSQDTSVSSWTTSDKRLNIEDNRSGAQISCHNQIPYIQQGPKIQRTLDGQNLLSDKYQITNHFK